jgi:glycosyltransferase involved in cell wall biosynthesis
MRIGFDAKRAFLNASGLGNYSRNTLNALRKYCPGNEFILFTPEIKEGLFEGYQHFKVVSPQNLVLKKLKSLWRSLLLVTLAKRHEVDIYHGLSNELPKGIRNSGIPSVVTIHDVVFMRYPEFYKPVDRKIYFKKVKHACKSANKIIAISQQTQNDLITFFKVPVHKVEVLYQPVSKVFFASPNTTDLQSRYNLPDRFILAVGTLEPRKNQLALLQAMYASGISIPVVFVGRATSYISRLKRFLAENDMSAKAVFLADLPEEDLAGLYQCAVLSVYISVFEGFGLPVIEAMACGCPVITSTVSVLPETAGDAAVLCNPAKPEEIGAKIKMLLENEALRNQLIEKGYKRAKLFHPEKYAHNLNTLYEKVLIENNAQRH